jgi:hypothetical protein
MIRDPLSDVRNGIYKWKRTFTRLAIYYDLGIPAAATTTTITIYKFDILYPSIEYLRTLSLSLSLWLFTIN